MDSSKSSLPRVGASRYLLLVGLAASAARAQAVQSAGAHAVSSPTARHARPAEIAGRVLLDYPWVDHVDVFFENSPISVALDPSTRPELVDATADVYVLPHQDPSVWDDEPQLVDVRGAPQTVTFGAAGIQSGTFTLSGLFSGQAGLGLGVGYDVVVDLNRDGRADRGDLLDGFGDTAGFYVCTPTGVPGPLAVTEVLYSGGTWLGEDIYYPTSVATMGQLPLVVVSHGNGHNYQWYDHIGMHLASWGYIVMSHTNDTMPGIETASTTTLTNTDHFLGNLGTIAGGVLNGHVDSHRIVWIGHSRGGEGVCRAYDRIFDGTYTPIRYALSDIKLVSSIAPTDFLGAASANPHAANYHLWVGGGDSDVDGCAASDIAMSYPLLQRSTGYHQSIELHGAGHGAFHAESTQSEWQSGPCAVHRADVHAIMKPYLLPLVKRYVEDSIPAREFLWRPWESFQSPGVPTNSCVVVDLQYFEPPSAGNFVIDDFQTNTATNLSSSGGAVTTDIPGLVEGRLDDPNTGFTYVTNETFNGMTEATAVDGTRGLVLAWNTDRYLEFALPGGPMDVRGYEYLSLRACQASRAPETTAALGDLQFDVLLVDADGDVSLIRIGAYGGGLEEPYQRNGCGSGTGWNNEWESVRMRLEDFTHDGTQVDLDRIMSVQLRFGPSAGEPQGRIGLDDLQFMRR
ncbi:MAG: hypothetical protein U1F29_08170 [Planctomycetota bacterium]